MIEGGGVREYNQLFCVILNAVLNEKTKKKSNRKIPAAHIVRINVGEWGGARYKRTIYFIN